MRSRSSPPSLRNILALLVSAVAIAVTVAAASSVWRSYLGERDRAAQLLLAQTRAMAHQVDSEFERVALLIRAVGASRALQQGDVVTWWSEVRAVQSALPFVTVDLVDPSGRPLQGVDQSLRLTALLPSAGRRALIDVGTTYWSDFIATDGGGVGEVQVYLAVARQANDAALIRLRWSNRALIQLLHRQRLAQGHVAAVLDRRDVLIARSFRADELNGRPATQRVQIALAQADEGVLLGFLNQDGTQSVAAIARAPVSQFAVVTAMPEAAFQRSLWTGISTTFALGALILALGLLLAYLALRRVTGALARLTTQPVSVGPTGLKETDELAQRLLIAARDRENNARTKDLFLAMLSHDLRTPLSSISNWVQLLRMSEEDTGLRRRGLDVIERNARTQARLVDDLLAMTSIEAGKLELKLQPVDLRQLAQSAVDTISAEAQAKGVTISFNTNAADASLDADPTRLTQVLLNLLANALKFTPPGRCVWVRVHAEAQRIVLEVADEGAGIEPDVLPHVFTAYRQARQAKQYAGGLGLGLAIAHHIVSLHGGHIDVRSAGEGQGSVFLVILPRGTRDKAEGTAGPSEPQGTGKGTAAPS